MKKFIAILFLILSLCFNLWADVESVTATYPIISSGGTNPNISITGLGTAAPLSQQYGDIIGKIIDPNPANLRGEISITTMQNSGLAVGRGL